jgi:hypothetical protein
MLNQELQRKILEYLRSIYGTQQKGNDTWKALKSLPDGDDEDEREKELISNMLYLEEHGLIESGIDQAADGAYMISVDLIKITSAGIRSLKDTV